MTQPGNPPTSPGSGRSIYERLGLSPEPKMAPPRRLAQTPPRPGGRKVLRYLLGIPLLLVGLALLWMNLPLDLGNRAPTLTHRAGNDDERRIDQEDEQIKQLDLRIEILEAKIRALQTLNSYEAQTLERHAPPGSARPVASEPSPIDN